MKGYSSWHFIPVLFRVNKRVKCTLLIWLIRPDCFLLGNPNSRYLYIIDIKLEIILKKSDHFSINTDLPTPINKLFRKNQSHPPNRTPPKLLVFTSIYILFYTVKLFWIIGGVNQLGKKYPPHSLPARSFFGTVDNKLCSFYPSFNTYFIWKNRAHNFVTGSEDRGDAGMF